MSLPPINPTTIALNNSAPGTTELFGKMLFGVGIGGAVICVGAVIYSKMNPPTNSKTTPVKGGTRRALRMRRNETRKA